MQIATMVPLLLAGLIGAGPVSAQLSFDDIGGSFAPAVNYAVGIKPYAAVVADFNADDNPDLAVGNTDSDSISILLGQGNGMFAAATAFAAGDGTEGVAVADFNGDGKLDLAAANLYSSNVSILLGTGTGSFGSATHFNTGTNPHAVVVADLNGDNKLDLATADGSAGVSVLLGNGLGAFAAPTSFSAWINPRDLKLGDFNGDGKPDLVVTNQGGASISILLGNGAGGFATASNYAVGSEPQTVATGDFNADGKLDIAVPSLDKVSILLGTGTGTFVTGSEIALAAVGWDATTHDIDADGKLDLVVTSGSDNVSVFLGSGTGLFGTGTTFLNGIGGINRTAVGDFNADGKVDLVTTNLGVNNLSILINDSSPPLNITPSATVDSTSSYTLRKSRIWINRQTAGTYPAGHPYSHAGYADIDQDGDTDFLRTFGANDVRRPVQVMINNGDGTFADQTASRLVGSQPGIFTPRKVLTGDYNGDAWPDFFVLPHGIDAPPFPGEYPQLFLSNGEGTIRYVPGLESEVEFHHGGASADVDGNGSVDILLSGGSRPFLLLNDGRAGFAKNISRLPTGASGSAVPFFTSEFIDVDGDGFIDLLVGGHEFEGMSTAIYWGGPTGLYRDSNKTALPAVDGKGVVLDYAAEDIDRDGRKDVIVNRTGSPPNFYVGRHFQVLRQTAARQFADETATRITMNHGLLPLDFFRMQDINGDGFVDIFIDDKNDVASGEYAWTNNGQGVFAPYTGPVTPVVSTVPFLSISDASVTEGNSGTQLATFTVRLSHTSASAVTYSIATANGIATAGSDYEASSLTGESIAAGLTGKTFVVTINGDTVGEPDETFTVNLSSAVGATISRDQAIGTITNDDTTAAPTANFSYTPSNLIVNFTDSSTDSDGSIVSRSWNFGDGATSSATNPSKTYAAAGTYGVQLTVTDNSGATATITQSVRVTNPVALLVTDQYLWMVPPAASTQREGFLRLSSRQNSAATLSVWGLDSAGRRSVGTINLSLAANESRQFNSTDMELGNLAKGLTGSLGEGLGDWTIIVRSSADIEALAYIRTPDGFLTAMHDRVDGDGIDWFVPMFNPAENPNQVSHLRVINTSSTPIDLIILGVDDAGASGASAVVLSLPALTSVDLSSSDLESGNAAKGLTGGLGNGSGKWHLSMSSTGRISVQSLLADPLGKLTNLSTLPDLSETTPGEKVLWLVTPASNLEQQGFVRLINRESRASTLALWGIDDAGQRSPGTITMTLAARESKQLNSQDLESGNPSKGLSGSLGNGTGSWRLVALTDLDLIPLALIRTPDGFLTTVHETLAGNGLTSRVSIFNPAENPNQVSLLRIVNPNASAATVSIRAVDDLGLPGPGGLVSFSVAPGAAIELSAVDLENGSVPKGLSGSLGNGSGKWALTMTSSVPLKVLNLLRDPRGYLTNLSTSAKGSDAALNQ